jgi:hypothetical protein
VLGFYNVIVMGIIVAFLFFVLALRAIRGNFKYVQVSQKGSTGREVYSHTCHALSIYIYIYLSAYMRAHTIRLVD